MNIQAEMSDAEIEKSAREFVDGLLGTLGTKQMCFMVSSALAGYLDFIGLKCEAVEGLFDGWHHWWIEMEDGRVIDATSDQFKGHRNYWLEKSELHHVEE